ncbi:MAG: hypothetical protein HYR52_05200 [Candidatus Tectomicrobia bacterium]|nr:hypothetical protein [Candidatus Tectomicrobia bacterium]MBI3026051.1 hypothetical protein [Candidatus Tectomicrobia bacterium]
MPKKPRVTFKELLSRLTGFSTPVFGVSWNPPKPERGVIRNLFTFLEDRRVLFNPFHLEVESQVTDSVLKIREELTKVLGQLPESSNAAPSLRAMRAACRRFMDEPHPEAPHLDHHFMMRRHDGGAGFFMALGELRAVFGTHLGLLAVQYGLDVEGDLASIMPPEEETG